jgi:hypothetical protein
VDRVRGFGILKEAITMRNRLNETDLAAFAPSEKIALVATLNEAGEPHITLLTTLAGRGPDGLTIGEFTRGLSKAFMAARPQVGFLVLGLDRRLWRGRALWRASATEGPEYIAYNNQPRFRYNAYFGINTVHYLDLAAVEGPEPLPTGGFVLASLATLCQARLARPASGPQVLSAPALGILDRLTSLNFLACVGPDRFPRLVPVLQARSAGASRIVFTPGPYRDDLRALPEGTSTALFSMNLQMESFLARGRLGRVKGTGLLALDLDFLYNSAPPCHGQVYPRLPLAPMTEFR